MAANVHIVLDDAILDDLDKLRLTDLSVPSRTAFCRWIILDYVNSFRRNWIDETAEDTKLPPARKSVAGGQGESRDGTIAIVGPVA